MNTEKTSMRELVIAVGGMLDPARENKKSYLTRVAKAAGISIRMAFAAHYDEPVGKDTARALKLAAGKHEAQQLAQRFEGLAMALNVRDEDFHRDDVSALISAARALRGLDRAGD